MQRLLRVLLGGAVAVGVLLPATASAADPSPADVERQLEKAHEELEDIVEDYNRIGEELKLTQAAAADIEQRLGPLQKQLDAARADVTTIAALAYKNGGGLATASVMLTARTTNAVAHQIQSIDRVARARQREIATYNETKDRHEAEKRRLDALLRDQTEKQKQIAARKDKIEAEIKRLEEMERRLESSRGTRRTAAPVQPVGPAPSGSGKGAIAARFAYAQIGKMYRFGASGPNNYDCSGLTQAAWRAAGVSLPHNAAMQYRATPKVGRASLALGDLVFYRGLGHVGIYIGNDQIVHAFRTGRPVSVAPLNRSGSPYGYTRPG
jgi:peptidoglycan DL-endopeptidase CwlO